MEVVIYLLIAIGAFGAGWFSARMKKSEAKIVVETPAKAPKRAYTRKAKTASATASVNVSKVVPEGTSTGYVNGAHRVDSAPGADSPAASRTE